MKMKTYAPIMIIAAALLWSLDGLLRRHLYSVPPETIVFLEHLIGFIVVAPIVFREKLVLRRVSKKVWFSVFFIALFGGAVGTIAYTAALGKIQYIPFSVVVLLQQLQPFFALALAALVLKERITPRFFLLAVIAVLGAYAVSFPDLRVHMTEGNETVIAALLALLAAFSWGASTVFGRYALSSFSYTHLSALRFGLTSLVAFLYLAMAGRISSIGLVSGVQWWYIVAIVFSTGLVALLLYYKGLSAVPAKKATLLELTWPLSAIVVDVVFFGTTLSATQWLGALVLFAVIVGISKEYTSTAPEELTGPVS